MNRTAAAGFVSPRIPVPAPALEIFAIAGGAAGGDIDGDGDIDLVVVGAGAEDNYLYVNNGDATFAEAAEAYGVRATSVHDAGPLLVDYDGDGHLDLIMGGVREMADWDRYPSATVFRHNGAQGFTDVTATAGLVLPRETNTYSLSAGDTDGDGFLDLFLSHWRTQTGTTPGGDPIFAHGDHFLWRNDGAGAFADVTAARGLSGLQYTFTGIFSDVDGDRDLDLLVASDFNQSRVLHNDGGAFAVEPTSQLTDGNGMGAAVGDYDNDGDMDWFVSSIWDPNGTAEGNWDVTGNRLYRNDGAGRFTDVSEGAGVRIGFWGWGSCLADFDNDGHLDLFHVNGMQGGNNPAFSEFIADPSRLFMSNGDATFTERSAEFGLNDVGQGRGVVCFDAERDGDVDILVANAGAGPAFFVNDRIAAGRHYLSVVLRGPSPNTQGIGAWITAVGSTTGTQVREIRAGNNYVSQNPAEAHFGLGGDTEVDLTVSWPDGAMTTLPNVAADQVLIVRHPNL